MHRARLSNDTTYLCCDLVLFIFFPVIPCFVAASCVEGVEVLWRRRKAVCGLASEQQKAKHVIWTDLGLLS